MEGNQLGNTFQHQERENSALDWIDIRHIQLNISRIYFERKSCSILQGNLSVIDVAAEVKLECVRRKARHDYQV